MCELPPAIIEIDSRFRSRLLAAVSAQRPVCKALWMFPPTLLFRSPSKFARTQRTYRIFASIYS